MTGAPGPDGTHLPAARDGAAPPHAEPRALWRGDLGAGHGVLRAVGDVFIGGSVRPGAHIDAVGDIYVQGDVISAHLTSRAGGIRVAGRVSGTARHRAILVAAKDLSCAGLTRANVAAGGDLRLERDAWACTLKVGGNLYLRAAIEACLLDVETTIGGAVLPPLDDQTDLAALPAERRHMRVAFRLPAHLALHGAPPLTFQAGAIEDISVGGVRFAFERPPPGGAPPRGALTQLKFTLPDEGGQVLAIARVARAGGAAAGSTLLGLTFAQMSHRDRDRVQGLCRQLVLGRRQTTLGTRSDRQPGV